MRTGLGFKFISIFLLSVCLLQSQSKADEASISETCKPYSKRKIEADCVLCKERLSKTLSDASSLAADLRHYFAASSLQEYISFAHDFKIDPKNQSGQTTALTKLMDTILEKTSVGHRVLSCYKKTNPPEEIKKALEYLIKEDPFSGSEEKLKSFLTVTGFDTKFSSELEKNGAAGKYDSVYDKTSGGYKKTMLFNSKELEKNPIFFLLVYAHEMQHGCYKMDLAVSEIIVSDKMGDCGQTVSEKARELVCKGAKQALIRNLQLTMVDELRSFVLMTNLFRELVVLSPEKLCQMGQHTSRAEAFFEGDNEGEVWSLFEQKINDGTIVEYVVDKYLKMNSKIERPEYFYKLDQNGKIMLDSRGNKILNGSFEQDLKSSGLRLN